MSEQLPAVDCHAHVFLRDASFAAERRYTPDYDAPADQYIEQLDRHGLSHGVLIQPSFLGSDNSYMLQALAAHPGRLRGIAVLPVETPAATLRDFDSAGIAGLRLNLLGRPLPAFDDPVWRRHLAAIAALRWQVEVQAEADRLPQIMPPLLDAGVNIVIDHFGKPDPAQGTDDPGFRYLLTTAQSRRVWVKLSGAYRAGGDAVALEAARHLHGSFGLDRLVWGSDWPHTQFEDRMGYGIARAALDEWLPDPADRRIVLGETAARLFRLSNTAARSGTQVRHHQA
jgi:predicted TIM-barrel fold metal-dependent hydrolase